MKWGGGTHKHSRPSMIHLDYVSIKNEPEQDIWWNEKKKKKQSAEQTQPR